MLATWGATKGAASPFISAPFAQVNGPLDGPSASWYNGWSADYAGTPPATISSTPAVTTPAPFSVTRPGYDTSGAATTVTDTVYVTRRVRQPYPNTTTMSSNTVALSEYVHQGDTVYGGAVNNSTAPYPKVIARWATVPKQVLGAGIDIEVTAFHKYGRNGKPVAAVLITGTPTTGSPVTKTCTYAKSSAYGDSLPVWKANFADSDFPSNGNADVTFNFVAYPWAGDSGATRSSSGGSFPSTTAVIAPIVMRTGGQTVYYAYVDGVGAGTPAVNTNPVTASANAFATIDAAAQALFAQSSNVSAFRMRLKAGSYTWTNTAFVGATRTAPDAWWYIEGDPADPNPYANVTVTTSGTNKAIFNNAGGTWSYISFKDMTLVVAAASNLGNFGSKMSCWLNHVNLQSAVNPPMGGMLVGWVTQCDGTTGAGTFFTLSAGNMKWEMVRATTTAKSIAANTILSSTINAAGVTNITFTHDATNLAPSNVIVYNSKILNVGTTTNMTVQPIVSAGVGSITDVAVIQTVFSSNHATGGPCIANNDQAVRFLDNQLFLYLTASPSGGQTNLDNGRFNLLNDPNAATQIPTTAGQTFGSATNIGCYQNFTLKFSLFGRLSYKHDFMSGSNQGNTGAQYLIGGWAGMNGTGIAANISEDSQASFRADTTAYCNGFMGFRSLAAQALTYVDRANNNFKPTSGFATVLGAEQTETWDLNGVARRTDDTGAAGAIES